MNPKYRFFRSKFVLILGLLIANSCTTADLGTATGGGTSTGSTANAQADKTFVVSAASSHQLAIKLSELALKRSANLEVQEFAKLMAQQHGKLSNELKSVAQQMSLTYPGNLAAGHQSRYDQVAKVSSTGFEKAFAKEMEILYQQDLAIYQQAGRNAANFALRVYALKNTAVLQGHLGLATQLKNILP